MPSGTTAADFSRVCTAPALMTPGSVQPGMGTARSIAPVATRILRASTEREAPSRLIQISWGSPPPAPGTTCQTVLRGS